jgi:hypothetical protein
MRVVGRRDPNAYYPYDRDRPIRVDQVQPTTVDAPCNQENTAQWKMMSTT